MELAVELLGLIVAVLVVTWAARRLDWSPPLCLVVVGVAASFVPGVPDYHLNPELVLVGLLPPLLYSAAIETSLIDIRANRVPIATLSVALVAFTTVTVGLVTWAIVPGLPLAAGFALGAVVAPPDAVAATAVARRVGMPRRIVRILEGESLLNDAVSLVALRTAIAAIAGSVSVWQVGVDFVFAAAGGVVVGGIVGWGAGHLLRRVSDSVLSTGWSFVVPFVAYLPAEAVHGSGVLAVVVAGISLGNQLPRMMSGSSRLATHLNWRTIDFLLENIVFLLIGLQLRRILSEVAHTNLSPLMLAGICLGVLLATIASRFLWMFGSGVIRHLVGRRWPWSYSTVIGWAGMRGVVTLAAAFVLPSTTPERAVLVLAAFVVVAGTLLFQGTTLPRLVRLLRLPAPDPAQDDLQEAALLHDMIQAGLARLEEIRTPDDPPEVIDRLQNKQVYRSDTAWERLGRASAIQETPSAAYHRLRAHMLAAERDVLLAARDRGSVDDEVLQRVLTSLDIEESLFERPEEPDFMPERELHTPAATAGSCVHLDNAGTPQPGTAGCEECLKEGTSWVHLRLCLECGHVGCCDSSPRRHATAHYHETHHPVIRSFEPGENWRWCFVDGIIA